MQYTAPRFAHISLRYYWSRRRRRRSGRPDSDPKKFTCGCSLSILTGFSEISPAPIFRMQ